MKVELWLRHPAPVEGGVLRGAWAAGGAALIALCWVVYGSLTLHDHGVTLDETSIFYAGDRTLFFLTHPWVHGALDFIGPGDPAGFSSRFPRFPDFADTWHYPVLPGLLMAITNQIFSVGLHWVDDIDGHHLGLVLLHGLGLFAFAFTATRLLGTRAGLAAAAAYALYPSIVGFGFNDPKDLPACDFYGAAVLAAAGAFAHRRARDLWAAGVLIGLSLSCKLNGAFAAATLALWLLVTPREWVGLGPLRRPLLWLPAVAFAVFFALWPWLWYGTPVDWWNHFFEYLRFYAVFSHSARPTATLFPFIAVGSMTPPLDLALAALGLVALFMPLQKLRSVRWLIVLWLALPLVRIALPYSEFYDANRHFIEYIGALCVLVGLGAEVILAAVAWWSRALAAALALAGVAVLILPLRAYRPFEGAYFNSFVGGLGGAQARALFFMLSPPHDSRESGSEGDFWNSSLRGALRLADQILPPGTVLGTCGPSIVNDVANVSGPLRIGLTDWRDHNATALYFMGRECYCKQSDIREAETQRPVLVRVTRGGGLIYEILGPLSPYPLPAVSPHTRYEELPHYPSRRPAVRHRRQPQWFVAPAAGACEKGGLSNPWWRRTPCRRSSARSEQPGLNEAYVGRRHGVRRHRGPPDGR